MQFGLALWRVLKQLKHENPKIGPIYLSKIDTEDGFYQIWIQATDVPNLGVLFPSRPGDEPSVGFQIALPMS
jgi:hypothetical protein